MTVWQIVDAPLIIAMAAPAESGTSVWVQFVPFAMILAFSTSSSCYR